MAERRQIPAPGGVLRTALLAAAFLMLSAPSGAAAAAPANDDFADALQLPATLPANDTGTLAEASGESGEPEHVNPGGGNTVWYRWKPTIDTTVAVATCGSASYSGTAVYGHGPVSSLGPRLGTRSDCLNGTSSIVHAEANKDYWIAIENVALGTDPGEYTLKLEVAGSIAGRVLNESSNPVNDHCVRVLDPATGTPAVIAHTDGDGRWSVELPPAGYQVRFDGCTDGGPYAREYWQNAADVDAAATLALAPGQARTGVDATLEPAASIAGDLTRPGGGAVSNACVRVYDPDHPDVEVASTNTDPSGHYQVTNLAAAGYKILFEPGCISNTDLKDEYYNDKGTFASADTVTLSAGQSNSNIGAVLGDGGSISGTVSDAAFAPLADICVSADPVGDGIGGGATSVANGSYTIAGLDPGSYVIKFSDCGSSAHATEFYDDSADAAGADPVAVAREQDVAGIDASLQENGSITGTVSGPSAEPLESVCAVAFDAGGNEVATDITDQAGAYAIAGLAPGQYRMHFVDCADAGYVGEFYADKSTLEAADPIAVSAGAASAGINATLASVGAISGTVTGPGGSAAEGVCVSALSADGQEMRMNGTDAAGTYVISQLSPGPYKVEFRDCGSSGGPLATEFYNDSPTFSGAANVVVQEGLQVEDIDAALTAAGSISGTVTMEGSEPAADACVSAFPNADAVFPLAVAQAAADGTYKLEGLASGGYKVYVDGSCSPDQLSEEFYDDAATFASATAVSVSAPADHGGVDADLTATQAPTVSINSGPVGATADATPTFAFARTGGGAVECSIDTGSASYGPCSNQLAHTPGSNLADGPYTFRVRVSNAAGEQTATRSFSVDTTAPPVSVSSGPNGPTNQVRPSFGFSAEAGASVQCSIDSGSAAYGPCSAASTHQPGSDLAAGGYTFRIRATDAVGNSAVATRTFTVDTTKPAIAVTGGPSGLTANARPTFSFNPEAGATVECSIDTGSPAFGACSGPGNAHTPGSDLGEGARTFRVRATDAAGNSDTATRAFTVDTVAPNTTITAGPAEGATVTIAAATFSFTSSESGSSFECKLDGGGFAPCSSPKTVTSLANGAHSFEVRAIDGAGNVDGSAATRGFSVDTSDHTPPETTFTSGPGEGATIPTAATSFGFSSSESGSTFECKLDGGAFEPCSSPRALGGLADGPHSFAVQATDPNGNTDPTPASRTFTVAIDSTAPDTVIDSGPSGTISTNSAALAFHSSEPGSSFECQLDGGGFAPCSSPRTLSALANGAHSFAVRAIDGAGNVDPSPATRGFTVAVAPIDPPPPPPDTGACDAAEAQLASANAAMKKAKAKAKKAKSKTAKKKAKAAVKKAKAKVKSAQATVAGAC